MWYSFFCNVSPFLTDFSLLDFFIFVASILSLVVIFESGGVTTEAASSTRLDPTITFPNSTFFYQDQKQMNLATCQLDPSDSTSNIQYLADYAFLGKCAHYIPR